MTATPDDTSDPDPDAAAPSEPDPGDKARGQRPRGERQVVAAIAVLVSMVIPLLLPKSLSPGPT